MIDGWLFSLHAGSTATPHPPSLEIKKNEWLGFESKNTSFLWETGLVVASAVLAKCVHSYQYPTFRGQPAHTVCKLLVCGPHHYLSLYSDSLLGEYHHCRSLGSLLHTVSPVSRNWTAVCLVSYFFCHCRPQQTCHRHLLLPGLKCHSCRAWKFGQWSRPAACIS